MFEVDMDYNYIGLVDLGRYQQDTSGTLQQRQRKYRQYKRLLKTENNYVKYNLSILNCSEKITLLYQQSVTLINVLRRRNNVNRLIAVMRNRHAFNMKVLT